MGNSLDDAESRPVMKNGFYNFFKFIALILLPAAGALYFGLAQIWHLPKAEEVVGTITLVDTFLGVLLGLSSRQYNRNANKYFGDVEIVPRADGTVSLQLILEKNNPRELFLMDSATFRIVHGDE